MSDQELKAAGEKIAAAIREGDVAFFKPRLDFRGIADWATEGEKSMVRFHFRQGLVQARDMLIQQLQSEVKGGGGYKFLGIKQTENPKTLVFRYITSGGGLNYHEMRVVRKADNDFVIPDIFIYLDGAWLSDTSRRSFEQVMVTVRRAENPNPTEADQEALRNEELAAEVVAGWNEDPRKVLDQYGKLPTEIQMRRNVLVARMQSAMRLNDDKEYLGALEDFEAIYPDDPAKELILLDTFLYREEFDKMLSGLDDLQKLVGFDDAYLRVLRGVTYRLDLDEVRARVEFQKAADIEPDLAIAHLAQLDMALGDGDFERATRALSNLEGQCGVAVEEIVDAPGSEGLRESPAYEKWRQTKQTNHKESDPKSQPTRAPRAPASWQLTHVPSEGGREHDASVREHTP
jgi:tetratricopeptide (TPR) repeat protein